MQLPIHLDWSMHFRSLVSTQIEKEVIHLAACTASNTNIQDFFSCHHFQRSWPYLPTPPFAGISWLINMHMDHVSIWIHSTSSANWTTDASQLDHWTHTALLKYSAVGYLTPSTNEPSHAMMSPLIHQTCMWLWVLLTQDDISYDLVDMP